MRAILDLQLRMQVSIRKDALPYACVLLSEDRHDTPVATIGPAGALHPDGATGTKRLPLRPHGSDVGPAWRPPPSVASSN